MSLTPDEPWAWEKDHGFDEKGFQRKEGCQGIAECPICGNDVELIAETECWVEIDGWNLHHSYGPAIGYCCDWLIVDSWDGCHVYELPDEDESNCDLFAPDLGGEG